jgi:mRNA interferase HicA
VKRRAFIQHLQQHGCVLIREGGNHSWWGNPAKNKRSSVPRHAEVNDLLARKICKDLDIPKPTKT